VNIKGHLYKTPAVILTSCGTADLSGNMSKETYECEERPMNAGKAVKAKKVFTRNSPAVTLTSCGTADLCGNTSKETYKRQKRHMNVKRNL